MAEKRKRAVNFTPKEQNLLFSIALNYKSVLENKQTNAVSNASKNEAWTKITNVFNATSSDFNNRTCDQLRRLYENKRIMARKKVADIRQHNLKTGGGPPPTPKKDEDDLILATMDPLTFEGLINEFDSDNGTHTLKPSHEIEYISEPEENQNHQTKIVENKNLQETKSSETFLEIAVQNDEIKEKTNWKKYTSNDLKKLVNPVLMRAKASEICISKENSENIQLDNNIQNIEELIHENTNKAENRCGRGAMSIKDYTRRRPTATVVKSLASNALSQKYNELADKKLIIADHAIKKIERERLFQEDEHRLRIKNLEIDLQIKKKQLEKLSNN